MDLPVTHRLSWLSIRALNFRRARLVRCMAALSFVTGVISSTSAADSPQKLIREQKVVSVQGIRETWQLVWDEEPTRVCDANELSTAITCPCSGFAYGEKGPLSLIRLRGTKEIERINLGPLFLLGESPVENRDEHPVAVVRRRDMKNSDFDRAEKDDRTLGAEIEYRKPTTVMQFADYDHDGSATEFMLQIGTLPCGKHESVVVGVSKSDPSLHAFSSAIKPKTPLVMPSRAWSALLKGAGPRTVVAWECGDHGSDTHTELVVSSANGAIRVVRRELSCADNVARRVLLKEEEF